MRISGYHLTSKNARLYQSRQYRSKLCTEKARDPLRAQDIDVWYERENLEPGTDWEDPIRAGLESSDWFLSC